ncbi:hypothetical protein [Delftia sp. UME58]|uniref:hypothetical protein n=1 Tax=Delftia sp. UME58 TaxID=1862322 RepID=UPI00160139C6|nr:hypothetical protein [Delftia sp. UME58]MBB1651665.1 hypothetical protein [Delftia sp. UME58]
MNSSSSEHQWQQQPNNLSAAAVAHLVKARARELDRDESRLFVDIEQQVVQQLQALAWRPPARA